MKIGILTLPLWNNYGGILQAYALQNVLTQMGHETWLIDRDHRQPSIFLENKKSFKRFIRKNILQHKGIPTYPGYSEKKIISKETLQFIDKYIKPKTLKIVNDKEMKALNNEGFEAYIVGSDQIWRPRYAPSITNSFFDFVESNEVLKISYAASFGVDNWEYSELLTKQCGELAQNFNSVSVREDSAVKLCKEHLSVDALHVLDPTMIVDKNDYIKLVENEKETNSSGKLFTYILDVNPEKQKVIDIVASENRITPFTVMAKPFTEKSKKNIEEYSFPKVTKWIKGFIDAEYTIVDSFHGLVFSIIFNKPFIVIGNKERGIARFTSILKIFNLEDRLIYSSDEITPRLLKNKINWQTVNKILSERREASMQFLQSSLSINVDNEK